MRLLSSEECQEIVSEFDACDSKLDESGESFYRNSVGVGNLPTTIKHVDRLTAYIHKKYPGAVFSNSYTREYRKDSFLRIHTDRVGLDLTMSVCLEKNTPIAWPLHVSKKIYNSKEWSTSIDVSAFTEDYDSYDMAPGVGVVCEGRKYPHWRELFDCEENDRAVYVFYHWTFPEVQKLPEQTMKPAIFLESPSLALYENFLSDAECALLIWMAGQRLTRSTVVDNSNDTSYVDDNRTSFGMSFSIGENSVIASIEKRISDLLGMPVENGEGIQVLRYGIGQEYKSHFDYFDPNSPGVAEQLKNNRVCTLLMYLNTPEEGGETIFPDAKIQISAKRGNALLFAYPEPSPESKTLHASIPVSRGEKWVATKWIRAKKY